MARAKGSKNKSIKGKYLHLDKYWTIKNLAREYNLNWQDLHECLVTEGMTPKKAIKFCEQEKALTHNMKIHVNEIHSYMGCDYTLRQWSVASGIKLNTLRNRRYKKRWSIKRCIETKVRG